MNLQLRQLIEERGLENNEKMVFFNFFDGINFFVFNHWLYEFEHN
jgi:hypothetical protein